jgi:hypothetical protein
MLENGIEAEEMSFSPLFSYVMGKEEEKMVRGNTTATTRERENDSYLLMECR